MDWKKIGFVASLVSIVGSIAIYFNGDENLGIFVGLPIDFSIEPFVE